MLQAGQHSLHVAASAPAPRACIGHIPSSPVRPSQFPSARRSSRACARVHAFRSSENFATAVCSQPAECSSSECLQGSPAASCATSQAAGQSALQGAQVHGLDVPAAPSTPAKLRRLLSKLAQALQSHQRASQSRRVSLWGGSLHRGAELAALGMIVPVLPGSLHDLLANRVLVTGFLAWFAAQFGKVFTWRYKRGFWDIKSIVQPGGMPSSHSSLCAGITTALALQEGLSSPLFAVSFAFSSIVMYDAMGVRQHAGKQAAVLNQVVQEVLQKNPALGDIKLKEVLGHTPRQVLFGALLGLIIAMYLPWGSSTPQPKAA